VVDFACPARRLAIELDGGQHAEQADADAERSAELASHRYRVIRFWNNEVIDNLNGFWRRSAARCKRPHLTRPLRPKGAERGRLSSAMC